MRKNTNAADTRVAKVITASKSASTPDATNASDLYFSPCALIYRPIITFTTIATAIITNPGISKVDTSGCIIFSTDSLRDPIPAPKIIKAMAIVVIYSIRP